MLYCAIVHAEMRWTPLSIRCHCVMELRQFRYFVVAAEEENFSRAAARLHVAQSALSRQIQLLERQLGLPLFERTRSRVHLTEAGRIYYEDIERILGEVEFANERASRYARGQSGTLRVGMHSVSVRFPVVSRALHAFRSAYPHIELLLSQRISANHLDALHSRGIDVAFVVHTGEPHDPLFASHHLGSGMHVLALPQAHALARRRSLRLADLKGEPFLWLRRSVNPPFHDALMRACLLGGLSPRIVQYVLSQDMTPKLVATGMGLSFVLSPTVQKDAGVVLKKVADLSVPMQIDLVWRRDNQGAALKNFIATVRKAKSAGAASTLNRKTRSRRGSTACPWVP